jgi:hypothetical protein
VVQLHRLGWGDQRIAGELGCSRKTVKRYLAAGGWVAIRQPHRKRRLDGLEEWLAERRIRSASLPDPATSFANLRYFRPVSPKETRIHKWDQEFESAFLQRRVRNEPCVSRNLTSPMLRFRNRSRSN